MHESRNVRNFFCTVVFFQTYVCMFKIYYKYNLLQKQINKLL